MLNVGFLSAQNYYSRTTFSGTLFSMHQALKRRPIKVVDLGWPMYPGLLERIYVKVGALGSLKPGSPAFDARSQQFHRNVRTQLKAHRCDVLMAAVASSELQDLEVDVPVAYASDATFKLLSETYDLGMTPEEAELRARLEQRAIDRARGLLYPSRWAADSAVAHYGAPAERIRIAPYGANLGRVPRRAACFKRLADRRTCRLLFVGRDFVRKGGAVAVACLRELQRMGIHADLTVVGATLPRGTDADAISVFPFLDKNRPADAAQLTDIYLRSHVLVFPTRADCSPIALCEAAAFGLPVVCPPVGGIGDIVSHGETGILVPRDASAGVYAEAIAGLWADRRAYADMVRAARMRYEARLNWDAWGMAAQACLEAAASG